MRGAAVASLGRFAIAIGVALLFAEPALAAGYGEVVSTRNPGAGAAIRLAPPPYAYTGANLSVTRATTLEAEAQVGDGEVNRGEGAANTSTEVKTEGPSVTQALEVQRTVGDAQAGPDGDSAYGAAGSAGMIKVYDIDNNDYFSFKGFDKVSAQSNGSSVELKAQKFQKTNKGP
jgi:hypothetical protein